MYTRIESVPLLIGIDEFRRCRLRLLFFFSLVNFNCVATCVCVSEHGSNGIYSKRTPTKVKRNRRNADPTWVCVRTNANNCWHYWICSAVSKYTTRFHTTDHTKKAQFAQLYYFQHQQTHACKHREKCGEKETHTELSAGMFALRHTQQLSSHTLRVVSMCRCVCVRAILDAKCCCCCCCFDVHNFSSLLLY